MFIYIRTLTGKRLAAACYSSDTVEEVKGIVERIEGIPHDQQRLIFSGNEMENGGTMADYNVQSKSSIDLVLRIGLVC